VNGCLSLYVSPVVDWHPVQGVLCLSFTFSYKRLQSHATLYKIGCYTTVQHTICDNVYVCISWQRYSTYNLSNYSGEDYNMTLPSSHVQTDFCGIFPEEKTHTLSMKVRIELRA